MLSLILSGFLMSAGGVGGQLAATAVWEKFFKANPEKAKELPTIFTRWLQASLRVVGETVEVDGEFGLETEKAVKSFQVKSGLEVIDGIAGPKTLAALAGAMLTKATQK